ncbi:hypothetical protein PVK06_027680 [Gossypium arboreum]|uniref:Reverse transcriptase domain-containing protein n=1 Tax=Gossypium arboreum TaxID=29729 RepID=A0ABR0P1E4_GOSAR|nr:hypothetical protein PVK06_027680 [Gossypium arboreum]
MRSRKNYRKWMTIKLDLEKAYDRISWEFIDASLVAAGIPDLIKKVIMDDISSSTMQILWNEVSFKFFNSLRGVKQGCPLSPYLFVLCMYWLSHLIRSDIVAGSWNSIRLSRSGPKLSHLFFTDDLVIFGKAEMNQAQVLKEILQRFCDFSGHKISTRKSNMYFSKRVDPSVYDQINQFFGFQKVSNIGRYFGVPHLHDRVSRSTLNFVVDKENSWSPKDDIWKFIRKYQGPQRVHLFLWIVVKHRLFSNSERARRGIGQSSECPQCDYVNEDIMHMLRDCSKAKDMWKLIVPLWRSKSVTRSSENASAGRVVRDRDGHWILGFTHYLGRCSPFEAELWGILDGILILLNKGYKTVNIQTDNIVVRALNMEENVDFDITLLRRAKRILRSEEQWKSCMFLESIT